MVVNSPFYLVKYEMNNSHQNDDSVSFTKGIGIMLMVLGHSGFWAYGNVLIYMFHMPLFFFISGYCFKNSHLENFFNYAKKRITKIYVPFIKYSLIFLLLHNLLFHLNIYNDIFGFNGIVSYLYSPNDYLKKAFHIIIYVNDCEELLGGYWFLHTLFFASFIFYGLLKLKIPIVGVAISLLFSVLLSFKSIPYIGIYCGSREFYAVSFMMAGYIYKNYSIERFTDKYNLYTISVCVIILIMGSVFWHTDMISFNWTNAIPYYISAVSGTIIVMNVSNYSVNKKHYFSNYITIIGYNTMQILTWHFSCFKIVSLIIIKNYNLPIEHLAEFPIISTYTVHGWWICYFIVGVVVPIIGTIMASKLTKYVKDIKF